MKRSLKDFILAFKLLKREGLNSFMRRLYWYAKGARVQEDMPVNISLKKHFNRQQSKKYPCTRILFVSHDGHIAGAQLLLLNLIEWLSVNTNIEIKVLFLESGELYQKFSKLVPTFYWPNIIKNLPADDTQGNYIKGVFGDIDLIYGNTVIAAKIYDVLQVFDVPFITHVHELETSILNILSPVELSDLHKYSDAYIACSPPVAENLIKNHQAASKQLVTINAFIDSGHLINNEMSKKALRKKLKLMPDSFTVFGCGTIDWRKGTDLFIETAIELKRRGQLDFHFYWIGQNLWDNNPLTGSGLNWSALEKKIADSGISQNISFLGLKSKPQQYFFAGDVFFLSSREDPFPLAALEAAASKLPVICFENAGGIPALIGNDAGSVVFPFDIQAVTDALMFFKENPDQLRIKGELAKEKVIGNHIDDIAIPQILNFCLKIAHNE
jgi:glycosyltransferase involved in cell wall biosynthesis